MATLQLNAQDQNFWIFLCFGQSNMAGQAPIEEQDLNVSDRYLSMATTDGPDRELGTWRKDVPPLCRADAHLGPADRFGRTLIDVVPENVRIGIVSVAVEGCLPSDDNLHFSGKGYRLLGRHYALRYLEVTNPQLAEVCRQKLAAACRPCW